MSERAAATTTPTEPTIRDRIVTAARDLIIDEGWASVTMQRLADVVGVSRQTVYNEIGGKEPLARALVLDELSTFLAIVDEAFAAHPTDLIPAIEMAVEAVLEHARDNTLLRAVVSATHGADTDLLPLLTTNSEPLLEVARTVLLDRVRSYPLVLGSDRLEAAIDLIVRAVLSHVMQPSGAPSETAASLAWIADRVLSAR